MKTSLLLLLLLIYQRHSTPCSLTTLLTAFKSPRSWDPDIDKLVRLCTNIQKYVISIDNRIKKLERPQHDSKLKNISQVTHDYDFLNKILPIENEQNLKELENLLEDTENKDAFIYLIKSLGGKHPKDCLWRILKLVYTNNFGTQCSWLGHRNNIRISNTPVINIIKDVSLSMNNALTSHDFETFASEWFRLSKMRLNREQPKTN